MFCGYSDISDFAYKSFLSSFKLTFLSLSKVYAKGNVSWTAARNAVKYKVGKTVNGKTYYTGELTTNSTTITVSKSDYKVFVVAFDKEGNKTWGTKVDVKV